MGAEASSSTKETGGQRWKRRSDRYRKELTTEMEPGIYIPRTLFTVTC